MPTDYPEFCLKGVPSPDQLDDDNRVQPGLYAFSRQKMDNNGQVKQSVVWQDCQTETITRTRYQKHPDKNEYQFKGGVVKISLRDLEYIRDAAISGHKFTYEREPLPNNDSHGNLILLDFDQVPKKERKWIELTLALMSVYVCPGPEE
jgi:hypothetical protein